MIIVDVSCGSSDLELELIGGDLDIKDPYPKRQSLEYTIFKENEKYYFKFEINKDDFKVLQKEIMTSRIIGLAGFKRMGNINE